MQKVGALPFVFIMIALGLSKPLPLSLFRTGNMVPVLAREMQGR